MHPPIMPKLKSPTVDKQRSPLQEDHSTLASAVPDNPTDEPPLQPVLSVYPAPGEVSALSQPSYSETILQTPTLATDSSTLPPQIIISDPTSVSIRRRSSSSMRNASMTFENVTPSATPTGRISKAKKGKRVHACEFPGCGKVFTRAEHRRRHELNHNPEAIFRCPQPGCGKPFHRMDLLQRHQERHELGASPSLPVVRPHHTNVFTSPPSVLTSVPTSNPPSDSTPRTTSSGLSIGSLVHPHSQYGATDASLGFNTFVSTYAPAFEPVYFYGSEGSQSPASDHIGRFHRQSISSTSSVAAYEPPSLSPTMSSSIPGGWVPATVAPPIVLPSNVFEEGQTSYIPSNTVNSMPVHLRELDGHEFATIQRELSNVPELIFDSSRPELPRYIRSDCLEHYWKYFHPSFPIVYKPNFVTNTPPPLLLSAVLAIGSFYDSRPDAKYYSLALQEIATKLLRQRENITSRSRIADLQTVLLLEILGKYCARHTSPETSARFRALFASLHQSRQILVQSPLAVYKTLKADKSDDDLKRAHKFWLEHEARRRIFHACSVLDAQQIAFFDQRPTIVTHDHAPKGGFDSGGTIDLPCDEDLWETSPLKEWSAKAALAITQNIHTVRATYQSTSVDDFSFFQHQIINVEASPSQRCMEEMTSPRQQPGVLSKTRFNYHIFQMAKFMPVRSLLIVVGESWFLGRKIELESDYEEAKRKVREWISQASSASTKQIPKCVTAHWHALKVLRMITDDGEDNPPFASTNMLHEDWAIYLATLVCWAHSYGRGTKSQISTLVSTPATSSPSQSRKRKSTTEVATPPRKRQAKSLHPSPNTLLVPSAFTYTTQVPQNAATFAYADANWSAYGSVNTGTYPNNQWSSNTYHDPNLVTYADHVTTSDHGFNTEPPVYTSSVAASIATTVAATRTATNTPQSQISYATTAVTFSAPINDDGTLSELKAYLALTDVASSQHLATLDTSIIRRTKGLLDAVRIYKIGSKRAVGGLMNDAERVLARLVDGRSTDML